METSLDALVALLRDRRVVVLTGAGLSTGSGIPDYRGPETRRRARNPIRFADYMGSEEKRARYWARSMVGWERFSMACPNVGHAALAAMEREGTIDGVITQNVDRLHHRAGSANVVELHGALEETGCLDCGAIERRHDVQARMKQENPGFSPSAIELAPDGDAEILDRSARRADRERECSESTDGSGQRSEPLITGDALAGFVSPRCVRCGRTLKPRVVFFGENVRPAVLADAYAMFDAADVLLVVGSSLAVFSGYRFVRRAKDRGMPVAIVNLGETRGDSLADVRIEGDCASVLPELAGGAAKPAGQ
jgi:NAD-dependent deacetylase sirtuin 4